MPVWKSYLYHLQQQAPKPKRIVCNGEATNKPPYYGREYHGAISREDADFLLTIQGEGSYLIRESQRAPGQYTLAIRCSEPANENQRFEGVTKNFKLYYDGQHYVGEKRFDTINDLVADGLITFYLESKASDYIATLSSHSNYAESPYVAYNTHKKQQLNLASPTSGANKKAPSSKTKNNRDRDQSDGVTPIIGDDGLYERPTNSSAGNIGPQSIGSGVSSTSSSSSSGGRRHSDRHNGVALDYDTPMNNETVPHPAHHKEIPGPGASGCKDVPVQPRRRHKRDSGPSSAHSTPSHHAEIREPPPSSVTSTPNHQPNKQAKSKSKQSNNKHEQHTKDTRAHEQLARRRSGPKETRNGAPSQRASMPPSTTASVVPPAVPPHATPVHGSPSSNASGGDKVVSSNAGGQGSTSAASSGVDRPLSTPAVTGTPTHGQRVAAPHTPQMGSRSKVNLPVEGRLSQILETRKQHDASQVTATNTSSVTTTTTSTASTVSMTTVTTATVSSTSSDHSTSSLNGRVSHSTNTDGPPTSSPGSTVSSTSRWRPCSVQEYDKSHRYKMFEESGHFATPPSSPPTTSQPHSPGVGSPGGGGGGMGSPGDSMGSPGGGMGSPGGPGSEQGKASSVSWCTSYLLVKGCAKPHNFKCYTFKGPHWCDFCANFLWGLIAQGVKCQDCGFNAHKKCSEKVPNDCMPDMRYVKRIFGVDLTTLVKAQNTLIPVVVEMCIKEIEARGLEAEGLYRVAGFHDDVEAIKMSFDKDGELTDISEERYEDLNTITSLLKLYFRLLPIPLITFEIYYKVIDLIKQETLPLDERLELLRKILSQLQPAHFHTLKYLIGHLHRVTEQQQTNMMTAENLSIVFAPTLLRSPENDDPLTSLSAVKYERELVEILVTHHTKIFD